MPTDCISYSKTNYFSPLILDYLEQKRDLEAFYHRFPNKDNFIEQLQEKKASFPVARRKVLVESLKKQYTGFSVSKATQRNIEQLENRNAFTITTGHQLNLFTGPLYFLYKIVSTINLSRELKKQYPEAEFIPIYWMATEDHDFEEINFFNLHGKKFQWNPPKGDKTGGAVGALPTEGLEDLFKLLSAELGGSNHARTLKELFELAYLQDRSLAQATRYLVNELFGEYGLVIMDAQQPELKQEFKPYMKRELLEKVVHQHSLPLARKLEDLGYKAQVNPREINLFYLESGLRERIIEKEGTYYVNDTNIKWSQEQLLEVLDQEPESFSPNVMMRPLYQEVILPNLCYIGGGGELAYWFELKDYFKAEKVPFPILLLRNSALLQTEKQQKKRQKLQISIDELFLKQHELINRKVRQISNIDIDFTSQKEHLKQQFENLYKLAEQTDKSFLGAVKAQEVKQLKGISHLEKRLLKAQKRKLADEVSRITALQNELFPRRSLQERTGNFSEFWLEHGEDLIPILMQELQPLDFNFKIISL